MLNLFIQFEDPIERLLYGEPDPWLQLFTCRERDYTVDADGNVSYTEDGHTYNVNDEDLADDVRNAAASGDASNLTGTDEPVTVSDDHGEVVAANAAATRSGQGSATNERDNMAAAGADHVPDAPATPPITSAVADAIIRGEVSSIDVDGAVVSTDSNGYVTARIGDIQVVYDRDGQVVNAQAGEDINDPAAVAQAARDAGLLMSPDELHSSAGLANIDPVATQAASDALNYTHRLDEEAAWFREQLNHLPDDPEAAAARLDELASVAQENAAKWDSVDTDGITFTDADDQPITMGDYYRNEADRYQKSAADIRATAAANADFSKDVDQANAALTKEEGEYDPLEADDRPFSKLREAVGNLGYTAEQYERLAREWSARADNELVRIPVHGQTDDGYGLQEYITPAQFFAQQAASLREQQGDAQKQLDAAPAEQTRLVTDFYDQGDYLTPIYEGPGETGIQKRERLLAVGADITDPDDQGYIYEGPRLTGVQMEQLLLGAGIDADPDDSGYLYEGPRLTGLQIKHQEQLSQAASLGDESAVTEADRRATQRLIDQGYETWDGSFVRYLDDKGQPVYSEEHATYRIHSERTFTGFDDDGNAQYATELKVQSRNAGVNADLEGAAQWVNTGQHPSELLGRSDQNIVAESQYNRLQGRWVDQWGVLELPDQERVVSAAPGDVRNRGGGSDIVRTEMRGVPLDYVLGVNPDGTPILAEGWEEAVVPLSPDRSRVAGLNEDGTLRTEGGTAWHVAKPYVSALPGVGTAIIATEAMAPGSPDGAGFTSREWRELASAATIDSMYLLGWPYGAVNVGRSAAAAVVRGSGQQLIRTAARSPRALFWDASLPRVSREVGRQIGTVRQNPIAAVRGSGRPVGKGIASEMGEEFLVEYPFEVLTPHVYGVADKPLITGGESGIFSYRPGSAWALDSGERAYLLGSAAGFGTLEGLGRRRVRPGFGGSPDLNAPPLAQPAADVNASLSSNLKQDYARLRAQGLDHNTALIQAAQSQQFSVPALPSEGRDAVILGYEAELLSAGYRPDMARALARQRIPVAGGIHPVSYQQGAVVPGRTDTPWPTTSFDTRITSNVAPSLSGYALGRGGLFVPSATPTETSTSARRLPTPTPTSTGEPTPTPTGEPTPTPTAGSTQTPTSKSGTTSTSKPDPTPTPTSKPDPTPTPKSGTTPTSRPNRPKGTPNTPTPTTPDLTSPVSSVPDPQTPDPNTPGPATPEPTVPEPHTPDPTTPDPWSPQPKTPEPKEPEPETPTPTGGSRDEPTPTKKDPTSPPTPTPTEDDLPGSRRTELSNPVANDPNVHPREIEIIETVRHTVDTVTGERTLEPLDDASLRTARIKSFSDENPEGNVLQAGSVEIEVNPDHIAIESKTRSKDAGIDDQQPEPERPQIRMQGGFTPPTAEQRARMQAAYRASQGTTTKRPEIKMRNRPSGPTPEQRARIQENYRKQSDSAKGKGGKNGGKGRPPIKVQPGYRRSKSGKGERPEIKYLPGQGPAKKPDPYAGLMGGGGAARRGGGGRRRPTEEELEERKRRMATPKIELIVRS